MELPDFDSLVALAKHQPEKLEALRDCYNQEIIDTASLHQKAKLEGLLFKINMEVRRCKNPTQSCIKLSALMMDSFCNMSCAISDKEMASRIKYRTRHFSNMSNVIVFPVKN